MYQLPGQVYAYGPITANNIVEARKKVKRIWQLGGNSKVDVWPFNRASLPAIVDSIRP